MDGDFPQFTGPHACRSLSLDIQRMASGPACSDQDAMTPPHKGLTAFELAIIRGEMPMEFKKTLYRNSLRRWGAGSALSTSSYLSSSSPPAAAAAAA